MVATPVNRAEFTVLRSSVPWTTEEMIIVSNALPDTKVARGGPDSTILAIRREHGREELESLLNGHQFRIEHVGRAELPIDVSHDDD